VCKDFFRYCTGFGPRTFDKMVKFVEDYALVGRPKSAYDKYFRPEGLAYVLYGRATLYLPEPVTEVYQPFTPTSSTTLKSETDLEYVLLFLDDYFEVNDVDRDPVNNKVRYIRTTWQTVHEKYVQYCKKMRLHPVNYDKFCSIRYDNILTSFRYDLTLMIFLLTDVSTEKIIRGIEAPKKVIGTILSVILAQNYNEG
jgi:hypothetical protein